MASDDARRSLPVLAPQPSTWTGASPSNSFNIVRLETIARPRSRSELGIPQVAATVRRHQRSRRGPLLSFARKLDGEPAGETGGKISTKATTLNLFIVMMGPSILCFPALFAKGGFIGAWVLTAMGGGISCAMCHAELGAIQVARQHALGSIDSLEEVGGFYMGPPGRLVARMLLNVSFLGDIMCLMVLMGENMHFILAVLTYRWCVAVLATLLLATAFLKNADFLEKLSIVGIASPALLLVGIVGGSIRATPYRQGDLHWIPYNPSDTICLLIAMVFGFGPLDVLPTLLVEMRCPEELPSALRNAHLMVFAMYTTLGLVGYGGLGNAAAEPGNAVVSMCSPPGCQVGTKWVWGYILAGTAIASHLVGLLISMMCLFANLEANRPLRPVVAGALRALVVMASGVAAMFCPHFMEVLGIISTVVAVPLIIIFPTILGWKAARYNGLRTLSPRTLGAVIICLLGCVGFVVGLLESVQDLAAKMSPSPAGPVANATGAIA